jgi:hypothetical protein
MEEILDNAFRYGDGFGGFSLFGGTPSWANPVWIEDRVRGLLFDEDGWPRRSVDDGEYWEFLRAPKTVVNRYTAIITDITERLIVDNALLLNSLYSRYLVESTEYTRTVRNHIIIKLTGWDKMAKQSFAPVPKNVKSVIIRLPSSPTDNVDKQFMLRLLVVERIRAYIDVLDFKALQEELLQKRITIPVYYETDEQKKDYFESEAMEIRSLYDRIELDPLFKEDFMSLKPYQGHKWDLKSTTEHAILLSIEV